MPGLQIPGPRNCYSMVFAGARFGIRGPKDLKFCRRSVIRNHFTLVEKWLDEKAYEAYNLARHTRHFRDQLQPMLASPFDERIHTEVNAAE